ncbi:MAG: TonB-dependent receptor [Bacteroidota bacterium]
MKSLLFWVSILLLPGLAFAQTKTQTIKGNIFDIDSRMPLAGATVKVKGMEQGGGAISDAQGNFKIEGVPIGRRGLEITFVGYVPYSSDNLILNSTKELVLNIGMKEDIRETDTDEVLIIARQYPTQAVNDLSVVSTRSFSAEETGRLAAAVNDPGRMALSFPGVQQGGDDSENDIIIRGNSSFGMLWRLEGIDIPNPNHFARPGTSGGGITVFSAQLLARSDFSTGAMAAEYGNAISGAMDMHFRKGNMDEREYRIKLGLLGLDFATEGPIKQGRSSYLVNYRYSTLSILNRMGFNLVGERVDNDFQDLSYNLAFDGKDGKSFVTVFGMAGPSLEHYRPVADPMERDLTRTDHSEDRIQGSRMAAQGVTYTRLLDNKSYIKWVVAGLGSSIFRRFDTLSLTDERFRYNTEQYRDIRLTSSLTYSRKMSARTKFKAGLNAHQIFFTFFKETAPRRSTSDIINIDQNRAVSIDGEGNTQLVQGYAQFSHYLSEKLVLNAGFHALWLTLNQSAAIEPRLSMKYQISRRHSLSFGYGLHSQHLPLGAYFYSDTLAGTETVYNPNFELPFIRSHHGVLAYNYTFSQNLRIGLELYAQRLFNVPVARDMATTSTWWMLNNQSGIAQFPLTADGKGLNYGLDIVVEKYFSQGVFLLLTYSRFESDYEMGDGRIFPTRFSTKFASSYTLGKEFYMKKGRVLQIGGRLLYNGGFRYTPPDWEASAQAGRFISDETKAWQDQVGAYTRIDCRISYRANRPKVATMLSLDVQNVANRANPRGIGYDANSQELFFRGHPSGLIPVLSYQLDF